MLPPQQMCLQTTADRSGPWQCAAWEHDSHHSDSHYYISATPSLANTIESPSDIAAAINLQLKGGLGAVSVGFTHSLSPCLLAQYTKEKLPSVVLGILPSARETEDPLRLEGIDPIIPAPTAAFRQMSPWVATPGSTPSFTHITHPLLHPTMLKTPEAVSISFVSQPQAPQGWTSWTVRWATSSTGENECGPRVTTHKQGLWGFQPQRAWLKCGTGSSHQWWPGCWGHKTGWDALCNHSLCPPIGSQG